MNTQWYLSYQDGRQLGPLSSQDVHNYIPQNPNGLAWKQGMEQWLPINMIADFKNHSIPNPAPNVPPRPHFGQQISMQRSDEIDYEIFGEDIQYVEIELDPGESAIAEVGSMMYKNSFITMNTVFGDSSEKEKSSGFLGKLASAGKRLITGENLFITVFQHQGQGKAKVAFAAPFPGRIMPVDLSKSGGKIICQKDSFLCAAKGVSIGLHFQKRILSGLFGGEGFILQTLEGDGMAFIHAGGMLKEILLKPGEILHLDTGSLVAMEPSVDFSLERAGGVKNSLFGGEGFFFAKMSGPGRVWIQSMPFSRLAGRIYKEISPQIAQQQAFRS